MFIIVITSHHHPNYVGLLLVDNFPTHWIAWTIFRIFLWDFRIWYVQVSIHWSSAPRLAKLVPPKQLQILRPRRSQRFQGQSEIPRRGWPIHLARLRPFVWSFYESLVGFMQFVIAFDQFRAVWRYLFFFSILSGWIPLHVYIDVNYI